jgi:hypothetical protein
MAGMAHIVVRIIELGMGSALALAVIVMFALVVVTIVHSLHEVHRHG